MKKSVKGTFIILIFIVSVVLGSLMVAKLIGKNDNGFNEIKETSESSKNSNSDERIVEVGSSCGGDWSYMNICPANTYCKSLNQGPLAGGICTPVGE